jgi:IS5 family transposase
MAETAFSAIKRRFGPAAHPHAWYREFRELALTAAEGVIEQFTQPLYIDLFGG